jgi:hypothetical protein
MKLLRIFALSLFLLPFAGRAWGIAGHAMIGDIAEWHLTPAALAKVKAMLAEEGFEHLAQVASWPDEIRNQRKETGPWHYVDIPLSESSYDPDRDCPKGDCVIDAINRYRAVLADPYKSPLERREALKFLVHFVGDLQMPLHGADHAGDHGGNKVLVSYFGQTMAANKYPLNLHTVWDISIIEHHLGVSQGGLFDPNPELRQASTLMAAKLNERMSPAEVAPYAQDLDPVVWAMESHDLAAKYVYPGVVAPGAQPPATPVALGEDYDRRAWPVVEKRIQQGGLRLAAVLNQALDPASPQGLILQKQ